MRTLNLFLISILTHIFLCCGDIKIEYTNFLAATNSHKLCQVKGSWVKEKESGFDANSNQFSFFMKDDSNTVMKVVLDGSKPNNFEMAENLVAKGKVADGLFHAKEVLTKCPPDYESKGEKTKREVDNPYQKKEEKHDVDQKETKDTDKKQSQVNAILAQDLLDEYEGNQIRADKKYLNKKIQVQGTIYKISKSSTDYTVIELQGENRSYKSVQCVLLKTEDKRALQFSKGDNIVISGKCCGLPENFGYSDIMFLDCKIIQ